MEWLASENSWHTIAEDKCDPGPGDLSPFLAHLVFPQTEERGCPLTLHCSTLLFTSSSSSLRFSSLMAADDAPGPVATPALLLEFLTA